MTIGIPQALPYYHHNILWETFFKELDIPYVLSAPSTQKTIANGTRYANDETCLAYKLYMGHVASLVEKSDRILVPYFRKLGPQNEFCVRFWGLFDTVASTFPDAKLLSYSLNSRKKNAELHGFLKLGKELGKSHKNTVWAYRLGKQAQKRENQARFLHMREKLQSKKQKVLLAGQDYLTQDPLIGKMIQKELSNLGVEVLSVDAWELSKRNLQSEKIAPKLYWHKSREILGAIEQGRYQVDAVILLTAFPCGVDCLTNDLVLMQVKNIPILQLLIDEHEGREGLITRLESFIDLINAKENTHILEAV